MTPANIIRLAWACVLLVVVLGLVGVGYSCARKQANFAGVKAEVKSYKQAAKKTEESVQISKDTQERVESESEDTRQRTAQAVEKIDAHIDHDPAVPGVADAGLLRIAREAHSRALSAHCRVQRAGDCTDTPAAP